jgi:serine protease Do
MSLKRWKPFQISALAAILSVSSAMMLPAAAQTPAPAVVRGLPDFTDLVDQVGPSVVNIRTMEKVSSRQAQSGLDPEMLEFFKRFGLPVPSIPKQQRPQRPGADGDEVPSGLGSGFILTADGYVSAPMWRW